MMSGDADIWDLVRRSGPIDAQALLRALILAGDQLEADARSKMLRRDSISALRDFWGEDLLRRRFSWFGGIKVLEKASDAPDEGGFHTIRERLVTATNPDDLLEMLRELGARISRPATVTIGGALALMLDALIVRETDDADVVDEIPAPIREEHELLRELTGRYGLKLTHFQSHYLPDGWTSRVQSIGRFGKIDAFKVDSIDVLTGKLFSKRTKDLDDVRSAWRIIDRTQFKHRLARTTAAFRNDPELLKSAKHNWYILTGEDDLPPLVGV